MDETSGGRICRFVTYDFPQYFAVVSRIRQEVHAIGPEGGMVSSTVVPQVQAVFPQGALTKKIKVGLQVNLFKPRKGVAPEKFRKISVNHVPKKKKFFILWWLLRSLTRASHTHSHETNWKRTFRLCLCVHSIFNNFQSIYSQFELKHTWYNKKNLCTGECILNITQRSSHYNLVTFDTMVWNWDTRI